SYRAIGVSETLPERPTIKVGLRIRRESHDCGRQRCSFHSRPCCASRTTVTAFFSFSGLRKNWFRPYLRRARVYWSRQTFIVLSFRIALAVRNLLSEIFPQPVSGIASSNAPCC